MTPARLRALLERGGGPVGALAGLERGLASAVLCERASADELPARAALARIWQADGARPTASTELLAERRTHVYVDGRPGYPDRRRDPDRPAVLLAEGDAPDAFDRRRVAIVGTRAATPHGLADAYELGAVLARRRDHRGQRARDRHRRRRARGRARRRRHGRRRASRPASTSCTRAATARCTSGCAAPGCS